jgi:hypothetical protein
MSQPAIYELGSKVYCSDADCGELLQFVVEPDLPRLTDLVVCSVVDGAARLVAPALARPMPYGVLLDCSRSAFERFPATPVRGASRPAVMQAVPDAQTRICRGDHVGALDGDAGRVLGLVVRAEDGAITHVLLAAGHVWHRKHVAVPVDYVAGLGFAGLDVLLTKDSVADFATH